MGGAWKLPTSRRPTCEGHVFPQPELPKALVKVGAHIMAPTTVLVLWGPCPLGLTSTIGSSSYTFQNAHVATR